jgi:Spy/CpxP family protein refolding chaperone
MKKQLITILFTAVIMFAGVYNSYAEMYGYRGGAGDGMRENDMPPMRGMKHPGMGMRDEMGAGHPMWKDLMALGLDEKQRDAINEIKDRVMKEVIRKRADERVAGIELKDLLDKDPVDIKAVEAKLKQMEAIKTEVRLSLIRAGEEAKSKLTADQRKKFKEMSAMRPMRGDRGMRGMMQGRMGTPPPYEEQEEMQPSMEGTPR